MPGTTCANARQTTNGNAVFIFSHPDCHLFLQKVPHAAQGINRALPDKPTTGKPATSVIRNRRTAISQSQRKKTDAASRMGKRTVGTGISPVQSDNVRLVDSHHRYGISPIPEIKICNCNTEYRLPCKSRRVTESRGWRICANPKITGN